MQDPVFLVLDAYKLLYLSVTMVSLGVIYCQNTPTEIILYCAELLIFAIFFLINSQEDLSIFLYLSCVTNAEAWCIQSVWLQLYTKTNNQTKAFLHSPMSA